MSATIKANDAVVDASISKLRVFKLRVFMSVLLVAVIHASAVVMDRMLTQSEERIGKTGNQKNSPDAYG